MAVKTIDDTILTDIADAIREKGETSETLYPHSMAQAIRNLQIGTQDVLTEVTVTPTGSLQVVTPVSPNTGFSKVKVNPIPSNYGLVTYNGSNLRIS